MAGWVRSAYPYCSPDSPTTNVLQLTQLSYYKRSAAIRQPTSSGGLRDLLSVEQGLSAQIERRREKTKRASFAIEAHWSQVIFGILLGIGLLGMHKENLSLS